MNGNFLAYLYDHLVQIAVVVFCLLVFLQRVKIEITKRWEVPDLVWWFAAWALGVVAALVVHRDCSPGDWRCWVEAAIVYSGCALIFYPVTKRITAAVREKILGQKT